MTKNSIALIGFMATGKSTVGMALAESLGDTYTFIETDHLIIEMAGKSIPRIFSEDGEKEFRAFENKACEKVSSLTNVIVSCGGGVVLNKKNIENLKMNCHMVLLQATLEEIFSRAMKDGKESRPLLNKEDPRIEIEKILNYRKSFYETAAEIIIETTGKKIDDIVREIVMKTELKA
ncbi:MAG: shikimate kinase [Promethearchaeota archaeon]|jgi:shikimate kinase